VVLLPAVVSVVGWHAVVNVAQHPSSATEEAIGERKREAADTDHASSDLNRGVSQVRVRHCASSSHVCTGEDHQVPCAEAELLTVCCACQIPSSSTGSTETPVVAIHGTHVAWEALGPVNWVRDM